MKTQKQIFQRGIKTLETIHQLQKVQVRKTPLKNHQSSLLNTEHFAKIYTSSRAIQKVKG